MRNRLLGVAVAAFALTACDAADEATGPTALSATGSEVTTETTDVLDGRRDLPTIADVAETNPNFSTLYAALEATGLTDTFDGRRQFTVFAPTNAAFEALLSDLGLTPGELLANTELVTAVLLYHATPGNRNATSVLQAPGVRMLNGQVAPTYVDGEVPFIDGAEILTTDLRASNGTIHVIGSVLLP